MAVAWDGNERCQECCRKRITGKEDLGYWRGNVCTTPLQMYARVNLRHVSSNFKHDEVGCVGQRHITHGQRPGIGDLRAGRHPSYVIKACHQWVTDNGIAWGRRITCTRDKSRVIAADRRPDCTVRLRDSIKIDPLNLNADTGSSLSGQAQLFQQTLHDGTNLYANACSIGEVSLCNCDTPVRSSVYRWRVHIA